MFLRATTRKKDGKEHLYWSVVENRRVADGRVAQRQVLYLGEINSSQELAWRKSIEVLEDGGAGAAYLRTVSRGSVRGFITRRVDRAVEAQGDATAAAAAMARVLVGG